VIDLDPQANATSGLGMRANGTSSYDLLDGAPLAELVHPTAFANLDLVPAKPDLAGAVVELSGRSDGERYLARRSLRERPYDFVFLDCPPRSGRSRSTRSPRPIACSCRCRRSTTRSRA
jgi:ATPases involved in chromosome partitioning